MKKLSLLLLLLAVAMPPCPALSWYPRNPEDSVIPSGGPPPVIGRSMSYIIGHDDTLVDLAYRSGLGYLPVIRANPEINPWAPDQGKIVLLPYATILPGRPELGITINLADYRLYYIWKDHSHLKVRIYPIGVGRDGWDTPLGSYAVRSRVKDPTWVVPESIQKERPDQEVIVPPGPENPLGGYWIGLTASSYGIHGTNKPLGVGRKVSHGCIRLYARDIEDLFSRVKVRTPVRIVYRPVKVGIKDSKLWVEIHPNERDATASVANVILECKARLEWRNKIDWPRVWKEIDRPTGLPFIVSGGPAETPQPSP